jgi:hypothetical protein
MTLLDEPAQRTPRAHGSRPRRVSRWIGLVLLAVLAGWMAVSNLRHHIEADRLLEPLRAAQLTASTRGESITTISPGTAERWSNASADQLSEAKIRELVGPANELLEPTFVTMSRHFRAGAWGSDADRCYYVAVQPGSGRFDADKARALVQLCYSDSPEGGPGYAYISTEP